MAIDYKKLLPSILRDTRWGQFMEAYQSIIADIKTEKIDPILDQFDIEKMSETELISACDRFGFNLSVYEGYSSTTPYYIKELLTIVPRILYKNCRKGYWCIYYVFNLIGDIYPVMKNFDTTLEPYTTWWVDNENPVIFEALDDGDPNILYYIYANFDTSFSFDSGLTFDKKFPVYSSTPQKNIPDTTLDADDFLTLDGTSDIDLIIRYILFSFKFMYIENEDEFLSIYSVKALENDVKQHKRGTEYIIYEPSLIINASTSELITTYTSEDGLSIATQNSILIGTDLSDISKIRFGTGRHTTINGSITDVQTFSFEIDYSDFTVLDSNLLAFKMRKTLYERQKMEGSFSEIAIIDSGSNCVLYSKFPTIHFPVNLFSNIKFEIYIT